MNNLIRTDPVAAVDIAVLRVCLTLTLQQHTEQKTDKRCAVRCNPLMNFQQGIGDGADPGFFIQLALCGGKQGFSGFQMPGGLIPVALPLTVSSTTRNFSPALTGQATVT